jgi:ABC-type branched-subunit amino acid transport system substrate-binding protein
MKYNKFLILFFSLFYIVSMHAVNGAIVFPTLNSIQMYAKQIPEYPELSKGDWSNPDFTDLYKQQTPNLFGRMLMRIGIKKPLWSINSFKELIEEQIRFREMNGLRGEFVEKINPSSKDVFILWGDLYGAFHSLVRDLSELQRKNIINQDLKIAEGYHFVINGNSIDNSPYSLVTLTLIMRLMQVNPKKVIYIKGNHEDRQKWQNYSLGQELKIKGHAVSDELIPLNTTITKFFNTLPLALYLCDLQDDKVNVVQISRIDIDDSRLDIKQYDAFLAQPSSKEQRDIFKVGQQFASQIPVELKAVISGEDRTVHYTPGKGLVLIKRVGKVPLWGLLSSPIDMNRRLYNYFYDSYVELTPTKKIDNWTLALFIQDVREILGFKEEVIYKLVSGEHVYHIDKKLVSASEISTQKEQKHIKQLKTDVSQIEKQIETLQKKLKEEPIKKAENKKTEPITKKTAEKTKEEKETEVSKKEKEKAKKDKQATPSKTEAAQKSKQKEYTFGSSTDLRPGSSDFFAYGQGLKLRFDQAREEGGIDGVMPKLVLENDYFDAKKTRAIVEEYIKQGITTILAPTGNANLEILLDLIKEKKILMMFPSTGLPQVRSAKYEYILHCRTNDTDEGEVLADYAEKHFKIKKGVVFVEKDAFGRDLLAGVEKALKKLNAEAKWTKVLYEVHSTKFDKQVEQINKIKPDAIIFCGVTTAGIELIRQVGIAQLTKTYLIANSDFSAENTVKFFKEKGLNLIYTSVMPNPNTSDLEIAKQYRQATKKANMPIDIAAFEPYFYADLAFELLKKIKGEITNQSILHAAATIKNYNYKGLMLNFNPQTRELGNFIWIVTDGTWELVKGKIAK